MPNNDTIFVTSFLMYHPIQSPYLSENTKLTIFVIRLHLLEPVAMVQCFYPEKLSTCFSNNMTDDDVTESGLQIKTPASRALSSLAMTDELNQIFVSRLCFIVYIEKSNPYFSIMDLFVCLFHVLFLNWTKCFRNKIIFWSYYIEGNEKENASLRR